MNLFLSLAAQIQTLEKPPLFERQNENLHHPTPQKAKTIDFVNLADSVDAFWGEGVTTDQKLAVFTTTWQAVDENFACFSNLDVDWQAVKTRYLDEISQGVSKGRFHGILMAMARELRDMHSLFIDVEVYGTFPAPGVPLMVVRGWGDFSSFGAGLTPLPDQSLLVYKTMANHPMGLVPGDVVMGFDGQLWRDLYPQLLNAEVPITGVWYNAPSAYRQSMLNSAGHNWHLFETVQIRKYDSNEVVSMPTSLLGSSTEALFNNEQLPVAGVPIKTLGDLNRGRAVSFGIIEGTQTGYIALYGMFGDAQFAFNQAVEELMFQSQVTSLVIDIRTCFGGDLTDTNPGLSHLFNQLTPTVDGAVRDRADDHFSLVTVGDGDSYIDPDPETFFDGPIAVLVGPGAASSGDQFAFRLKQHPRARLFGKPSGGGFNNVNPLAELSGLGFRSNYAFLEAYPAGQFGHFLSHRELHVDEEIWLTRDDVAQGIDTVLQAALAWIAESGPTCEPQRWLPHVTRSGGEFNTVLFINNFGSEPAEIELHTYDQAGSFISTTHLELESGASLNAASQVIFTQAGISHFGICAPESATVAVGYRDAAKTGSTGHVVETSQPATTFIVPSGEWDLVFEGLALVNLGTEPTSVTASLLNERGETIQTEIIEEALAPKAKALAVLSSLFGENTGASVKIQTEQPSVTVFLRGSKVGAVPTYLFQTVPLQN